VAVRIQFNDSDLKLEFQNAGSLVGLACGFYHISVFRVPALSAGLTLLGLLRFEVVIVTNVDDDI